MQNIKQILLTTVCLFYAFSLSHETKSIATQFVPYYNKFIDLSVQCESKVNDVRLKIEMGVLKNPRHIAICKYNQDVVTVSITHWKRLSIVEREQTILHELGHCLLNQRHDDTEKNLMNSAGFASKRDYVKYYDYLIRRLFKDCRKPLYEKFKYEEVK